MRKLNKKILISLVILCMMLMMLPAMAVSASLVTPRTTRLDLTVNPVTVSGADHNPTTSNIDGSTEGWMWYRNGVEVSGTQYNGLVLVLDGIDLRASGGSNALMVPNNTTIVQINENRITHTNTGTTSDARAIANTVTGSAETLTISGNGTLHLTATTTGSNAISNGIYSGAHIVITGGTINIFSQSGLHGYGIGLNNNTIGTVSVSNSNLNITSISGGNTGSSIGISASQSLTISNSNLDITSSSNGTGPSRGLLTVLANGTDTLSISGGSFTITCGTANENSRAIQSNSITISTPYWHKHTDAASWTASTATPLTNVITSTMSTTVEPSTVTPQSGPYNKNYTLYLDPDGKLRVGNVNGADVTGKFNPADISFDSSTNTWTLNDFVFESTAFTAVTIPNTDPAVTINLEGDNKITSTFNGIPSGSPTPPIVGLMISSSEGIPVIFEGDGELTVRGGTGTSSAVSHGINATHLTIRGDTTVNAIGGNTASAVSAGVNTNGVLTVEGNAELNATGGTPTTATNSIGINVTSASGHLRVTGGTINAASISGGRSIEIANTSQMTAGGGQVNVANGINLLGRLNLNANNVINASHAITASNRARSIIATGSTAITEGPERFYSAAGGKGNSATNASYGWSTTDVSGVVPLAAPGWRILTPAEILAINLLDIAQANVATQTVTPSSARTLVTDAFVSTGSKLVITGNGSGRVTVGAGGTLTVNGGTIEINNNAQNAITINDGRSMVISRGSVSVANTGTSGGINLAAAGSMLTIGSAGATSDVVLTLNGETSLIGTGNITGVNGFSKIVVGATAPTRTVSNFFNVSGNTVTTLSANTTYVWDANAGGSGIAGWKAEGFVVPPTGIPGVTGYAITMFIFFAISVTLWGYVLRRRVK
ncbi:MAG: hypothetical protein FWE27_00080 [Defluviitaleaceae bacterium]|nr:hypothetical protein [Defluviitaleaceae bacterium]